MGPKTPMATVVVRHLAEQVREIRDRVDDVRRDEPDSVHKVRVATRRLRSALASFRSVIVDDAHLRGELAWLARELGVARDAEVMRERLLALLDEHPDGPAHARVERELGEDLAAARRGVLDALGSERFERLLHHLDELVEHPSLRRRARRPAGRVLPGVLHDDWRRVDRQLRAADAVATAAQRDVALHEGRKAAKRARYAAECATAVLGRDARRLGSRAADLQDLLGERQDSLVLQAKLTSLRAAAREEAEDVGVWDTLIEVERRRAAQDHHRAWQRAGKGGAMKVVATYGIKGGVGKTSTAVNLASLSALEGRRTLLWDLDPQGAAGWLLRVKPKVKGGSIALLSGRRELEDAVKATSIEGLDLLPADVTIRAADSALEDAKKPGRQLARLLKTVRDHYDTVILDCPPGLSLLSENVFAAVDVLLTPLIPTPLSLRTWEQLNGFLEEQEGPTPQVHPFFSMVDGRKSVHTEVQAELRRRTWKVLEATIPASSVIERMGLTRTPVVVSAPGSPQAAAYRSLWVELAGLLEP